MLILHLSETHNHCKQIGLKIKGSWQQKCHNSSFSLFFGPFFLFLNLLFVFMFSVIWKETPNVLRACLSGPFGSREGSFPSPTSFEGEAPELFRMVPFPHWHRPTATFPKPDGFGGEIFLFKSFQIISTWWNSQLICIIPDKQDHILFSSLTCQPVLKAGLH